MIQLDVALVGALVAECFPAWAHLPVRPVLPGGHDNRTFRPGEHHAVRLPSAEAYVAAVAKEQRRRRQPTCQRAAGWALWKALIPLDDPGSQRTLARLREDLP